MAEPSPVDMLRARRAQRNSDLSAGGGAATNGNGSGYESETVDNPLGGAGV